MSLLDNIMPAPRREQLVLFVVDVNPNIGGYLISMTTTVLEELIRGIRNTIVESDDIEVKIAILQFGGCSWTMDETGPVNIEDYFLNEYPKHDMLGIESALLELNKRLNRNEFMNSINGSYPPIIVFIGSGEVKHNVREEIAVLKKNVWFNHAIKIAIKTDVTARSELFEQITGNPEAIFDITDMKSIKAIFRHLCRSAFIS